MNFIDFKGNLEIIVNYGGEPLLKAVREDVKGDHLLHAIDILNGEIINGMEQLIEKIKKAGSKYNSYKDFLDKSKDYDPSWTTEFKSKP